jgi:hypothetical protein
MPRLFLLAVVLLAAGCSGPFTPDTDVPVPVTRFTADTLSFTAFSAYREPKRLVITDEAAWATAWAALWHGRGPVPPLPAVDFGTEMVLLAARGEQIAPLYSIRIDAARQGRGHLTVTLTLVSPGSPCVVVGVMGQPADIARVPRTSYPVRYEERTETRPC